MVYLVIESLKKRGWFIFGEGGVDSVLRSLEILEGEGLVHFLKF